MHVLTQMVQTIEMDKQSIHVMLHADNAHWNLALKLCIFIYSVISRLLYVYYKILL